MYDKAALGTRYTCFQCGTRFYDLNRPDPLCPECSADQRQAPVRDIKALLAGRRRSTEVDAEDAEDAEYDDDELGLDDDDDDDVDDEDADEEFEEDE